MGALLGKGSEPLPIYKNANLASRQFNTLVRQYVNAHEAMQRVSPDLLKSGSQWYDRANEHAARIGKLAGGDDTMGAGIIAALSPNTGWEQNLRNAESVARTGTASGLPVAVGKASRILQGESPTDVLKGLKETPFFHNILNPDSPEHVTIDRHMHDAGIGREFGNASRGLGTVSRVNTFQSAGKAASSHLGYETPSRFQASLWLPWEQGIRPQVSNQFMADFPTPDAADAHVDTGDSDTTS